MYLENHNDILNKFWTCFRLCLSGKKPRWVEINSDFRIDGTTLLINLTQIYPKISYKWIRTYGKKSLVDAVTLDKLLKEQPYLIKAHKRYRIGNHTVFAHLFDIRLLPFEELKAELDRKKERADQKLCRIWWLYFVKCLKSRHIRYHRDYILKDDIVLFNFKSCYVEIFYLWNKNEEMQIPEKKMMLQALESSPSIIGIETRNFIFRNNVKVHLAEKSKLEAYLPEKYLY